MEVAAEHDHQANLAKQPAVNKLKMLPEFEQVSSVTAICVHIAHGPYAAPSVYQ